MSTGDGGAAVPMLPKPPAPFLFALWGQTDYTNVNVNQCRSDPGHILQVKEVRTRTSVLLRFTCPLMYVISATCISKTTMVQGLVAPASLHRHSWGTNRAGNDNQNSRT